MLMRFALPILCAATGLGASVLAAAPATAAPETKVTAPLVHENLAVYLVRGPSAAGAVPQTLEEALAKGTVVVHETGNVRELQIENNGREPVFIQFGDLVKGGQQDRVLTTSLLIPPGSGKIAIGAYCVEQGRWARRGTEDAGKFSSSSAQLFSRTAKVAIAAAPLAGNEPRASLGRGERNVVDPLVDRGRQAADPTARDAQRTTRGTPQRSASGQGKVWESVAVAQNQLGARLAAPMASDKSRTSLQLTLENERLKAAQAAFITALEPKALAGDDIVGVVFAINGKVASADIYPSNGLFRKMWPKLVRAAATEALAEPAGGAEPGATAPPSVEAAEKFLAEAQSGEASERALANIARHETRQSANVLHVEARRADGAWIHRNFLAK